ncbi:DUF255 domain-containing protein [Chitinophaga caseinilytica]|uniref:DUF255 domain-containing protein n=1 Tax=Chitinophaga caseinilytica TaxID=2267521 RepID=UPI003C2F7B0B
MKRICVIMLALMPLLTRAQVKFLDIAIEKAFEKAKKENKGVVIDVINNKIDQENIDKAMQDKQTTATLQEKFVLVRMDMRKPDNIEFYAEHVRNYSYPVIVFMNADKKILTTGYWDAMAGGHQNYAQVVQTALKEDLVKKENTRHINFLDIDYLQALERSRSTGKPVFIDCYFIGCGPCKKMDDNVFTLNDVADFYNENFICIKMDRAKDPHEVMKKFKVFGFPTHLYIKPDGELILKEDGFRDGEAFVALGQKALAMQNGGGTQQATASAGENNAPAPAATGSFTSSSASTPAVASTAAVAGSGAAEAAEGVRFEKLSFNDAIAKARAGNKAIYVDMSATWCQPCKMMKKEVFPDPSVVKYLNDNYIPIEFDCDIDSVLSNEYRDKFYTTAFPTHLLIDKNGNLIHKFVGYMKVSSFLDQLMKGVVADKGLGSFNKRYQDGERSPAFMNEYIMLLANANEGERASGLASEYLKTLPIDQLATRKNFFLISEFVRDIDSDIAQNILANKALFEKNISQPEMTEFENKLWIIKGISYVQKEGDKNVLDKAGFAAFLKRLEASKIDKNGYVKDMCVMETHLSTANWNAYADYAIAYMKQHKGKANPMYTWNWGARLENGCKDKSLRLKYAKELESNFKLVRTAEMDQAQIWGESIKDLLGKLNN